MAADRGPAHGPVPPGTTAGTALLCLLGHPVSHSRSPALHSAAIAAAGIDAVYLAFDVAPARFGQAVEGLRAIGFLGANATIPHKAAALAVADEATAEAGFVGVANTLFWRDGRLVADNTDAHALVEVLGRDCAVVAGDRVGILGAGGAARAAAVAAGRLGAAVSVHARRPAAAAEVAALAGEAGGTVVHADPAVDPPRVVVNATPLGRAGESLPPPFMGLGSGRVALDLNYGDDAPFLVSAREAGGTALDGMGMLVGQAEASFARWTGAPPPPGVMAAAVASG